MTSAHAIDSCTLLVFPVTDHYVPSRMVVNGTKGKQSVCIIAEGGRHWKIYDLEPRRDGLDDRKADPEDNDDDGNDDMMID